MIAALTIVGGIVAVFVVLVAVAAGIEWIAGNFQSEGGNPFQ